MAASKPSAESDVFRELYARLKDGIQVDLKAIAADLYSRKLISKGTSNSATNPLLDSESRAISLLNAIEEKIMISGSVFWEFLEILEVHRKNLAAELREKFKNRSEHCDGVLEDPVLSVPIEPAPERKEASSSYVPSITVSNGTALTGQCVPQADTSSHRDLTEQVLHRESGTMSPALLVGSNSLKPWLAQLGGSDGNEESSRIESFTDSVADTVAAAVKHARVDASEVQGDYCRKYTKLKQEYAKTSEYYKQELEHRDQKCKEFEEELELTRKELEQCKSDHEKEVSFVVRLGSAEDQKLQQKLQEQGRLLRQKDSELQEQNRLLQEKDSKAQELGQTLREKDSELQEMKQKLVDRDTELMEKDKHIHRVEAELNEMKVQLQQKEMELQKKEMKLQEKEMELREKKQENNLLQGRLEQEGIKQNFYMCKRIYDLVDQMSKGRNIRELEEISERIHKKIYELRVSVLHRKSL